MPSASRTRATVAGEAITLFDEQWRRNRPEQCKPDVKDPRTPMIFRRVLPRLSMPAIQRGASESRLLVRGCLPEPGLGSEKSGNAASVAQNLLGGFTARQKNRPVHGRFALQR